MIFLISAGVFPALANPSEYPNLFKDYDTFFPEGVGGTITGSSLLFFGFIGESVSFLLRHNLSPFLTTSHFARSFVTVAGFDEVCCMAARSENPSKTMPRAIAGTLVGAALLSSLAQLSLSYLVDFGGGESVRGAKH